MAKILRFRGVAIAPCPDRGPAPVEPPHWRTTAPEWAHHVTPLLPWLRDLYKTNPKGFADIKARVMALLAFGKGPGAAR
jgi:hypothetical protein